MYILAMINLYICLSEFHMLSKGCTYHQTFSPPGRPTVLSGGIKDRWGMKNITFIQ